jgi:Na+-driven multidrug efflux pump
MREMNARSIDLTQGGEAKVVLRQFLLMLGGLLVLSVVGVMDGYFISRIGTDALSTFGLLSPFIILGSSVLIGFGTGVTSTIARALGRGDRAGAAFAGSASYLLIVPFFLAFAAVCYFAGSTGFRVTGGEPRLTGLYFSYLNVWVAAFLPASLLYIGTATLRGHGMAGASSTIFIVGALITLAVDPLLIFGLLGFPELGLEGSALATLIGFVGAGLACVFTLWRRRLLGGRCKGAWALAKDVWKIGAFSSLTNCGTPIGRLIVLVAVGQLGVLAIAALSALFVIERFVLNIALSLASAIAPFVGQNLGKKELGRVHRGVAVALRFWVALAVLIWLSLIAFDAVIGRAFASEAALAPLIQEGLKSYPLYMLATGLVLLVNAVLNASARSTLATLLGVVGQLCLVPACAYAGALLGRYSGVIWGMTIGQSITAGVGIYLLSRQGLLNAALLFTGVRRASSSVSMPLGPAAAGNEERS